MTKNALADLVANGPKFDIVGPTVDDDVQRLIWRYGADAVKAAVKHATKPKRGRKPMKDIGQLRTWIERDAHEWIKGKDPFEEHTNYEIAKEFTALNPGHSAAATHRRIERKLAKDRKWLVFANALIFTENGPHADYIRAYEAYAEVCEDGSSCQLIIRGFRAALEEYEVKFGEPPASELSISAIREANRSKLLQPNALLPTKNRLGLFGSVHLAQKD